MIQVTNAYNRYSDKLIEIINSHFSPKQQTFCCVRASTLIEALGVSLADLDVMSDQWADIEEQLKQKNLLMLPALPDAQDEDVRIYRVDAPLTKVLIEALYPTPNGNQIMAKAITALSNRPRDIQQMPHCNNRSQPNGHNPRVRNDQPNGHNLRVRNDQPNGHNLRARNDQPVRLQYTEPDATERSSAAHYSRPLS